MTPPSSTIQGDRKLSQKLRPPAGEPILTFLFSPDLFLPLSRD